MTIQDKGFRFYVNPDRQQGQWLDPIVKEAFHPDWIDVTEWHNEKLLNFLQNGVDKES